MHEHGHEHDPRQDCSAERQTGPHPLDKLKHILAVGAGKGGVGKSTVAALLAIGLQRKGFRVGILDGDVYGPSLPKITGTEGSQPLANEAGFIVPPEKHGLRILSMGYLVPADQAVIWRGPMAQKYIKEFLDRTDWGDADCLIVDLPPGTGDIPLTLAQTVPLTGSVIVCTPQDVALADAVRAIRMYEKLGVETLGVVENMSYFICPHCGQREEIFGHGGARSAARGLDLPFLGEIPLNTGIRQNGDAGALVENFTASPPEVQRALECVTQELIAQLHRRERRGASRPTLEVE